MIATPAQFIELQRECIRRVHRYVDLINGKLGMRLAYPQVVFNLTGTTAGRAYIRENKIGFNSILLRENAEDFLRRTTSHEVAHLAAYKYYGYSIKPHGEEFNKCCWMMGEQASRCHNYDTSSINGRHRKINTPQPYATNGGVIRPVSIGKIITFD